MLIVEATFDAIEILRPLRAMLGEAVRGAGWKWQADQRVREVFANLQENNAIGDALFVPGIMADMAGQLMVHGYEAGNTRIGERALKFAADGSFQAPGSFLNLPWDEAIAEFKARGLLTDSQFSSMLRGYADQSADGRERMLRRLQERMQLLLGQVVERDQTFDEFADAVADGTADLGISEQNPSYLQTVFRTSIQSAYGSGRYRAATHPDVLEARPYSQYLTVGDAFVRPAHAKLADRVYKTDSDAWRLIATPNGWNCRCSSRTLTREEAKELGVKRVIPKGAEPEELFAGPPIVG